MNHSLKFLSNFDPKKIILKNGGPIALILFVLGILLSGCVAPANPNNLKAIIESNNAPTCINISNYSTMLTSCESCNDYHERPVLELKNECEKLFVSVGAKDTTDLTWFNNFYEGSISAGTSITNPGESGIFYLNQDNSSIYIIQKTNVQQAPPDVYEIKYRVEDKSK